MLTKLFVKFFAVALCLFFSVSFNGFAQENTYSSPDFFYSNAFDDNNLYSFSTFRNTTANTQSIEISNTSPLNGTRSLRSVNRATPVSNALSGVLMAASTALDNGTQYEFDFLYRYSTSNTTTAADVVDFATGGVASGTGGWRYWITANNATPSANGGRGMYCYQIGKVLYFASKESDTYTRPMGTYTIDASTTYIIKIIRTSGRYRVYIDPYSPTSSTTTFRFSINFSGGLATYGRTVLEMDERRTGSNFQFDEIKLYRPTISFSSDATHNSSSNGITPAQIMQGQSNVIALGYAISARGFYNLTRLQFNLNSSRNMAYLFNSIKVYESVDNSFSVLADKLLYTITPPTSNSLTYTTSTNYYKATLPNTVTYYFIVLDVNSSFPDGTSNVSFNLNNQSISYDNLNGGNVVVGDDYDGQTFTTNMVYKWVGTTTDWTTNTNWYIETFRYSSPYGPNGTPQTAPPSGSYVLIPNTTTLSPTATSDLNLNGLVIQSGKTLTLSDASLTVNSNLVTDGDLAFTGSANKSLTISTGAAISLANLTINKNAKATSVTLTSGNDMLNLTGVLSINKGTLVTNGKLTLKSSATKTASVAAITTADAAITGNVTVERYVTGGDIAYRGYRLFSSPVYEATVGSNNIYGVAYTKNSAYTTGTTGTTGGFDATATTPTLYLYREDKAVSTTSTGGNFRGINKINNSPSYNLNLDNETGTFNIPVGNGFMFFFRGNRVTNTTTSTTVVPDAVVFSNTGTLNQGNIDVKSWYTPSLTTLGKVNTRYHLVGNPYASTIDWNTFSSTLASAGIYGPNISNTIYVYNSAAKTYATYDGAVSNNNGSRYIPSGQGFFVLANTTGNASLKFTEAAKAPSEQLTGANLLMSTSAISETAAPQFLRLQLAKDDINKEDMVVRFSKQASTDYVFNEDSPYFQGSSAVNLYSTASSTNLAINHMPYSKNTQVIPLYANVNASGIYQLALTELKNVPKMFDVWLKDAFTNDSLDLRNNTTYNFNADRANAATFGAGRFSLVIRPNAAYSYRLLDFAAKQQNKTVQVNWKAENEANYTYFTVERSTNAGKTFDVIGSAAAKNLSTYSIVDKAPANGENQYRLKQEDFFGNVSYSRIIPVMYAPIEPSISSKTVSVYPNPVNSNVTIAVNNTTNNTAAFSISITNVTGRTVKSITSASTDWQGNVSDLLPGTYFIQVTNNKDKSVIGKSTFVKL